MGCSSALQPEGWRSLATGPPTAVAASKPEPTAESAIVAAASELVAFGAFADLALSGSGSEFEFSFAAFPVWATQQRHAG